MGAAIHQMGKCESRLSISHHGLLHTRDCIVRCVSRIRRQTASVQGEPFIITYGIFFGNEAIKPSKVESIVI